MAISDKLTYLNGTKQKLKQAINNLGGDITNETTFRNYATELDTLYSNFPKVEGEGSSITLSPTLKGKLDYENNIVGYGDTKQESTTGKNKYFLPSAIVINGITYTINEDETININGTSTAAVTIPIYKDLADTNITGGETYTFWVNQTIPSGVEIKIECYNGTSWQRHLINGVINNSNNTRTSTANITDTTRIRTAISITSGTTLNISNLEIQLEEGSSATSFEKYTGGIASPNPSYPQDIEVVRGTQTITIKNSDNTETQTQQISLGDIELCKIGNYQDYLEYDVDEDKVYKNKAINKKTFIGANDESWELDINYQRAYNTDISSLVLRPSLNIEKFNGISDKLIIETFADVYANKKQGLACSTGGAISVHIDNVTDTLTNVSQFKTWLASNPLTLYYVLNEAVKEEITGTLKDQIKDIYNLMSYNGTTNIEVVGDLPMIMKVRALKGE